jgi:vancomycin permeability regulator SanA
MKQKLDRIIHYVRKYIRYSTHYVYNYYLCHPKRCVAIAAAAVILPVTAILGSYLIVVKDKQYILNRNSVAAVTDKHAAVGIVLGAGVTKDGKPFRELQSRLDVAADALQRGEVQKLLLSGDNRFHNYDEPTAMKNYLINQRHIAANVLQPDFAGRSTYESCERASKVFGLKRAIIFSADSHLPRAIYLCRQFGVEAYGVASTVEANNATRREMIAGVKAVFNVYVHGENTILGPAITL